MSENINIMNYLKFELYDFFNDDARNLLYIDDDPKSMKLNLEITNNSDKAIFLETTPENSTPNANNFHLQLEFRQGELSDSSLQQITLDKYSQKFWNISLPEIKDNSVCLYLLRKQNTLVLEANNILQETKNKEIITFTGIAADKSNGVRGTSLNIRYKDFYFTNYGEKSLMQNSFLLILTILNNREIRKAPLAITFAYYDSILNDGNTSQDLTIQISNIGKENIILNNQSQFIITIDSQGDKKNEPSALIKKDHSPSINLVKNKQDWKSEFNNQAKDPQWIITPNFTNKNETETLALEIGDDVIITLQNIQTNLNSGHGNIYIKYQNLPGYVSDTVILSAKKTCFIERSQKFGINKKPDQKYALDVEGTVTATYFVGKGAAVPGMIIMWYGNNIPEGWVLCDGNHNTPDLRNRFVMGIIDDNQKKEGGNANIYLKEEHLPKYSLEECRTNLVIEHNHKLKYQNIFEYRQFEKTLGNTFTLKAGDKYNLWGSYINNDKNNIMENKSQPENIESKTELSNSGTHHHTIEVKYENKQPKEINILPPYFGLYFIMYKGLDGKST